MLEGLWFPLPAHAELPRRKSHPKPQGWHAREQSPAGAARTALPVPHRTAQQLAHDGSQYPPSSFRGARDPRPCPTLPPGAHPPRSVVREEQRAGPAGGPALLVRLMLMGGRGVQPQRLAHQLALQAAGRARTPCGQELVVTRPVQRLSCPSPSWAALLGAVMRWHALARHAAAPPGMPSRVLCS